MKRIFLLLAATGMIAAGLNAQTMRTSRTRQKTTITTVKDTDPTTKKSDGTLDLSRNPGNGATGVDGTINDATTSGTNNSGAIIDQRSNNTVDDRGTTTVKPGGTTNT